MFDPKPDSVLYFYSSRAFDRQPFISFFSTRAFRRLPEGQIASMWEVFAVHLHEGWNRGRSSSSGSNSGGGDELLAREVDAELFVLFVRNLHVTSSVASAVGKLCTSLAQEVCMYAPHKNVL